MDIRASSVYTMTYKVYRLCTCRPHAGRTALSTSEEPGLGYATFASEDKAGCITTCFGPDSAYFSIVILKFVHFLMLS